MAEVRNRLGDESSPYLRQHMHNPVGWWAWTGEALAEAVASDRPILLSIGYSACHWCHVMERESFEDPETAGLMNERFVNIKVDREERPDLDNIYQLAVQLLQRQGGWPLTVFLLPDGKPFYAGTYFPPIARWGMPSFKEVLIGVSEAYRGRRDEISRSAAGLHEGIVRAHAPRQPGDVPGAEAIDVAGATLLDACDPFNGGLGQAPKFPSCGNLWTLWRAGARGNVACRDAVLLALHKMAAGGIHDQIGGGFHRYSTDAEWLVPHFEKMLYDQAQLVPLYLEGWRATGSAELRRVAVRTLEYLARDMRADDGTFYAATDADSEGVEGKYFTWTPADVHAVARDAEGAEAFCRYYDVTEGGNWEGQSILRRVEAAASIARELGLSVDELEARVERTALRCLEARGRRVPPLRDDKRIASWNGLVILAFVDGWSATGDAGWLELALAAGEGIRATLVGENGLLHSACAASVRGPGLLDDHAAVGLAWLSLFEATGDSRWRDRALALAVAIDGEFADPAGGFFQVPVGVTDVVHRPRDARDNACPSGTSLAADFLLRLWAHTGEPRWRDLVERALGSQAAELAGDAWSSGHLLGVLDAWHGGHEEVVIGGPAGEGRAALDRAAREAAGIDRIVLSLEGLAPGHPAAGGRGASAPTAWVCRAGRCSLPITGVGELRGRLTSGRGTG